jgi:endonuclease YncB( thermonuclease family)
MGPTKRVALCGILFVISTAPALAAQAVVRDEMTLSMGDVSFRLDGIEAPALDQVCLDGKGAVWACGVEARDRLATLISSQRVGCHDNGLAPGHPTKRLGICWVEGDDLSLNQRLVREGWALSLEPSGKGRFKADQDDAQDNGRGLWKGCFTAPSDLTHWNKSKAKLLGLTCGAASNQTIRDLIFPAQPAMPPGCTIKGILALRAKITGHRGVYHMEHCRSYARAKWPNRWYCSEEDARADGFRKAFNC